MNKNKRILSDINIQVPKKINSYRNISNKKKFVINHKKNYSMNFSLSFNNNISSNKSRNHNNNINKNLSYSNSIEIKRKALKFKFKSCFEKELYSLKGYRDEKIKKINSNIRLIKVQKTGENLYNNNKKN